MSFFIGCFSINSDKGVAFESFFEKFFVFIECMLMMAEQNELDLIVDQHLQKLHTAMDLCLSGQLVGFHKGVQDDTTFFICFFAEHDSHEG